MSIFALRTAFYERARCVQSDPPAEGNDPTASETGARTDGPLMGSAEVAR